MTEFTPIEILMLSRDESVNTEDIKGESGERVDFPTENKDKEGWTRTVYREICKTQGHWENYICK